MALAQIGLIVQSGLIRREGLRLDRYRQDLQDAQSYADQAGFDDVHAAITQELDKLELSMRLPVESGVILAVVCADLDDESRIELLTMSDDEALGFCFTLLFAAGIEDPEAYLRERDILE